AIFSAIIIAGGDGKFVLYGVSLIGIGMLSITGIIVSMDTFGPVADNANGIFEMAGETDKKAQNIMANLDAVGNTTKAITKGFAIASAVIAAISLFGSFLAIMGKGAHIRIDQPAVFVGLLIGGSVPYLFSSLTIRAVGRGAMAVVKEVRRQFKDIPGIMEYKNKPDYAAVTDIVTKTALRELIAPGLLAIVTPIIIGLVFHAEALGGFLAGAILSGQLLAVFMSNAGGAWDNAKKFIEDGNYGGKGSEAHYATVIGDTVGDPFKDTSGPALDPLIKVINLVSLLIAPIIIKFSKLNWTIGIISGIGLALIIAAIWISKRDSFGADEKTADEEEIAFQEA
ncbi:MAG TPA: sodium-translocating pyrophosphatase, partial [Actinobacteria bacterium]|nr:sodium-translocating pyrophosphatase [Actinomycetes bacterium]HEX21235.1 sodium-translocating pyrophosphatase [Actinomycetota bacterium]